MDSSGDSDSQHFTLRDKALHGRNVTHIGLFLGVCLGMSLALPLGFLDATWRDPAPPPIDPLVVMALVILGFSFAGYVIGGMISMKRISRAIPANTILVNATAERMEYPTWKEESDEQ